MKNQTLVVILLRIALASVFLYAGVDSLLHPENWIGYFPVIVKTILPLERLLFVFSFYEIALAALLASGKKTFYAALAAAATLAGIILSNIHDAIIVFRDVGLFFAALALAASDSRELKKLFQK